MNSNTMQAVQVEHSEFDGLVDELVNELTNKLTSELIEESIEELASQQVEEERKTKEQNTEDQDTEDQDTEDQDTEDQDTEDQDLIGFGTPPKKSWCRLHHTNDFCREENEGYDDDYDDDDHSYSGNLRGYRSSLEDPNYGDY